MSISYPISFPTSVQIKAIKWTAMTKVATSESPFTGQEQVYEHQGQWFEAEISLPPMTQAQADEWIGFFLALNGKAGTFTFGDPTHTSPAGVGTGTPLVKGASQVGRTLLTDGWTTSQTGIMKAGDVIQLGTYMHKVTQDSNSDGSGNATLEIWPNLRTSPNDNDSITVTNPTSSWRLTNNKMMWDVNDLTHYGIKFTIKEAI